MNFNSWQGVEFLEFRQQLLRLAAELARFARNVHFNQTGILLAACSARLLISCASDRLSTL